MMSHDLGLFYRIALVVCGCVANAQSIPTTPEPTTLDWWGASTADMLAETPDAYHPRGLVAPTAGPGTGPQSQSQLSGASTTQAPGVGTADVVEIHSPQGDVERRVNGQPAPSVQPPARGGAGALNAASTLSGAPQTVRRPDNAAVSGGRPAGWALAAGAAVIFVLI